LSIFKNFFWYRAVSILNVITCTKIYALEKVFSLIIVTIANAKGCVHGCQKNFYRRRHQGILPKFFQEGAKSGEIYFFPLETKKTTYLVEIF